MDWNYGSNHGRVNSACGAKDIKEESFKGPAGFVVSSHQSDDVITSQGRQTGWMEGKGTTDSPAPALSAA